MCRQCANSRIKRVSAFMVDLNKKCFRNIYAPHGAKFVFIFYVEAKPVQASNQGIKIYKVDKSGLKRVV